MTDEMTYPEDALSRQEAAALCRDRAASYALLSRLFRTEVTADLLEQLEGLRAPASTGNASLDTGYRLLAAYLSSATDNALTELAVDYAHVFLGHGVDGRSAAYPYESVYTSEKRLLMQGARDEVLALYRSQGLDKHERWNESEDHLAAELEFMQILSERTAERFEDNDEEGAAALLAVQRAFLEDHLLVWVPILASDMRGFARTDLYRAVAHLVEGLLETDEGFLADILGKEAGEDE